MLIKSFLIFFLINSIAFAKVENNSSPIVLKWLVAHAPNNYFVEMAKYFKKRVEKETNNQVKIEILDDFENEKSNIRNRFKEDSKYILSKRSSYKDNVLDNNIPNVSKETWEDIIQNTTNAEVFYQRVAAYKLMEKGEIDMAQGYTHFLARVTNPAYHALELPYIFDDYNHIERFFLSQTAKDLLASTAKNNGIRGLAYTFSGGLLQTLSHENTDLTLEMNWNNKNYRSTGSLVRDEYLNFLGSKMIKITDGLGAKFGSDSFAVKQKFKIIRPTQLINSNVIDVEEITLPDIESHLAKTLKNAHKKKIIKKLNQLSVSETSHVLLSTVFMINEKSFQKLNSSQQEILQKVAVDAAKLERKLTIERYNKAKNVLINKGFKWYSMKEKERSTHRENAKALYQKLYTQFPAIKEIAEGIEKTRLEPSKVAGY